MELRSLTPALLPILALVAAAPPASAQDSFPGSLTHKLTLGAYYGEGDYGAGRDTRIHYLPLSYEVASFPWIASISVPYLGLQGPGDVFLEAGNVGRPGVGANPDISEDGLGDVLLTGTYQFESLLGSFAFVDFSLQVKLPTADESRDLGTGERDVSAQFDIYKAVGEWTLFSTLGYRHRGRTPLYELQDSAYVSLGAMRRLNDSGNLGLLYDFREAASPHAFETHELMPFYSWTPGRRWNLMVYTIVGFTASSADETLGFQLSYTWP